jgi:hypothetical protein
MKEQIWIKDYKKAKDLAEPISDSKVREVIRGSEDYRNINNVMRKFQQIEQKQRCLRVRFLDWLSDKLLSWSNKAHEMSVKIDSPCVIKLPEKK